MVRWAKYYDEDPYQGYSGYKEEFVETKAGEDTIWDKQTALCGVDPENEYDITQSRKWVLS